MKSIVAAIFALAILPIASPDLAAKNYSSKAERPAASDHTWFDYDYNFTLDESGMLTGTNTFSKVYNSAPTRWHNTGYYGEGIKMYTGNETLTITVLPGDFNYKYTLTTAVVEWEWDTHQLKWIKRRDMPTNGTRTFTVKEGILNGAFEVPVSAGPFGVSFICGNSTNGIIRNGGILKWKEFEYSMSSPHDGLEITSDGDSLRMNLATYMEDVKKIEIIREDGRGSQFGRFGSDENGTWAELKFPYIGDSHDILHTIGSKAGIGTYALSLYSQITLPDFYYDKYVDPYAPVVKILPNGHKLVSTLQPNQSVHTVETWEENGYAYTKTKDGTLHPVIGKKIVADTTFVHYQEIPDRSKNTDNEEWGYFVGGKYHITRQINNRKELSIDRISMSPQNLIVISDNGTTYYAGANDNTAKYSFSELRVESAIQRDFYTYYKIVKQIDGNGTVTVSPYNTAELSPDAKQFVQFATHPYIQHNYPSNNHLATVSMDANGNVIIPRPEIKAWDDNNARQSKQAAHDYFKKLLDMSHQPDNPMTEIQALIAMELDLPDYDTAKIDSKVIGKRTEKLLKQLTSLLNQKIKDNSWPNGAKKAFLNNDRHADFKKAQISRITKQGTAVSVYVTTTSNSGKETTTVLELQDNIPLDKYAKVWRNVVQNTK